MGQGLLYFALLYVGGVLFFLHFTIITSKKPIRITMLWALQELWPLCCFPVILLAPVNSLFIFPIPFPVPAWLFGVLYLAYSAYMGKKGADNIGHNAHFFGAVFGLVFTIAIHPAFAEGFIIQLFG